MAKKAEIQLFENAKIRVVWDDDAEKYFFSVVDVIAVLTESANPQTYWRVLKKRLSDEGFETVTNCNALKLPAADGKMRLTDVERDEVIANCDHLADLKFSPSLPYAFTEQGVAMLSAVLRSEMAIKVSVHLPKCATSQRKTC